MRDIFKQFDIELSDQQENKLKEYYKILVEENKKMNLTSITEYEDVVWKHFLDSALIMKDSLWNGKNKVFDVGTGAGFPGIVLAILNPESEFVLLDSLNKRVDFLKQVCDKLKINNVTAIHGRAETYGQNEMYRNQFDFVVSRAVAELPILMEYCVPFAKVNGYFVSYKGKKQEEEVKLAENAFHELSAKFDHLDKFSLREKEKSAACRYRSGRDCLPKRSTLR